MSNLLEKIENKFHPERRAAGPTAPGAQVPLNHQAGYGPAAGHQAGGIAGTRHTAAPYAAGAGAMAAGHHANGFQSDVGARCGGCGRPTEGACAGCGRPTQGTNDYMMNASSGPATETAGPHKSNLLNKLDPRVDSNLDSYGHAGQPVAQTTHQAPYAPGRGGHHAHAHGAYAQQPVAAQAGAPMASGAVPREGEYGPHRSRLANALDPRVDSDLDNRGGRHGAHSTGAPVMSAAQTSGPGPAPNTAGPHSSDLMNRLDPGVDHRPEHYTRGGREYI